MTWPYEEDMYRDPWGTGGEIIDAQYCCALCPNSNDGTFGWNPILEQLICGSCDRKLYHLFVWPASQAWLVELYPPILMELMAHSGRTYHECRRIYLEHEAVSLTRDILEDEGTEEIKVIMAPDGSCLTRSELLARVTDLLRGMQILESVKIPPLSRRPQLLRWWLQMKAVRPDRQLSTLNNDRNHIPVGVQQSTVNELEQQRLSMELEPQEKP